MNRTDLFTYYAGFGLMVCGALVLTVFVLGERLAYAQHTAKVWTLTLRQALRLALATVFAPAPVFDSCGLGILDGHTRELVTLPGWVGFAPEPLEPGPDSPLTTVEIGEPKPAEEPTAPDSRWPVPELLPQPNPEPVAAMLFDATGAYPMLDETVLHSGVTGAFPRLTDEVLAAFDAALKAGTR